MGKKCLPLSEIKEGDTLHNLRQYDNLYVPFGDRKVRMVENIETGPECERIYIQTNGVTVLAVLNDLPDEECQQEGELRLLC